MCVGVGRGACASVCVKHFSRFQFVSIGFNLNFNHTQPQHDVIFFSNQLRLRWITFSHFRSRHIEIDWNYTKIQKCAKKLKWEKNIAKLGGVSMKREIWTSNFSSKLKRVKNNFTIVRNILYHFIFDRY